MRSLENRINKLEETIGLKKKGPDKIIFETIGQNSNVISSCEIKIQNEKN